MNRITFGSYEFNDDTIFSVNMNLEESPMSDELTTDTLTVSVLSDKVGDKKLYTTFMEWYTTVNGEGFVVNDGDMQNYRYAEPIYYYKDNALIGKFFITQIDRDDERDGVFIISAVSGIGLMLRQEYEGGVFAGTTAGTLINAIMAGTNIPYTIDTAVSNTVVNGFLPYGYKRESLQMILQAIGANLLKNPSTGALRFMFNFPTASAVIPEDRIYIGGKRAITSPITKVAITEHTYYQNPASQSEIIYTHTGVSANHALVKLDEPIIPSTITYDSGITIHRSGANFVEFSGLGNIYATKYTHVSTVVSWENPDTTLEEHPCNVTQNTLITALNSANVLKRFTKYYTQAKEINCSIVVQNEKPGDYITFTDKNDDEVTGFIKSLNVNVSNKNKANTQIVTNWYPSETGNNFSAYQLIQSTGTVTVPTAARGKPGRLILFGGFCGGQGGTAGESGTASQLTPHQSGAQSDPVIPGVGGKHGGKGGAGGSGVMVYTVNITSLPSSFSVTAIGAGGAGGAPGAYNGTGSLGSLGGNTTVTVNGTSYSSANGAVDYVGFINFIDGSFYNIPGAAGYDNTTGTGGDGSSYTVGNRGGSVTFEGTTWKGGAYGASGGAGSSYYLGGGGGGAAYGSAGQDGGDAGRSRPGSGGTGATPSTPQQALFPYCGQGGHGGGCGGGAGGGSNYYGSAYYDGAGGAGGAGSPGGQGSNGAVIFYYGT